MDKKKSIVILIAASLLISTFALILIISERSGNADGLDTYDEEIILINKTFPVEVAIYGEDIKFRPEFQYRKIEKIDDSLLNYDRNKYERLSIVISDLNSSLNLTDEECKVITQGIDDNLIDFYYLGTKDINKLMEHDIIDYPLKDGDLSICLALYHGIQSRFNGIWSERSVKETVANDEALGFAIVAQIARCIRSNN